MFAVADRQSPSRPSWIRVRRLDAKTRELMRRSLGGMHTVCAEANCPNIGECWSRGTATFMILGDVCTRNCAFCNVHTGRPEPPDPTEPERLAQSVAALKLKYAVITCVDRDDLADGGAAHWVGCIAAIRARAPGVRIEVLTGDFRGKAELIAQVVRARPDVFAHNVETVPRLQRQIRHPASWERSLGVLQCAQGIAQAEGIPLLIKSGLMLGLGETDEEVREALGLLAERQVDLLTLGQYLRPLAVPDRLEVDRFVSPDEFDALARYARELGFRGVASSPLTRSSHLAETLYAGAVAQGRAGERG